MNCDVTASGPSPPQPAGQAIVWEVVITEWALDSYLNLKHAGTFTDQEYWNELRPDVERLGGGAPSSDPKFLNGKFWGPAKVGNAVLHGGYKMKWHQLGPGKVQLRLPVMTGVRSASAAAFLCAAYVKSSDAVDRRKMGVFKSHMNQISLGQYAFRGSL